MSINSVQSGINMLQPVGQTRTAGRGSARGGDGDGDGSTSKAGGFANAINRSLAQIGAKGSYSQNAQQALASFMQSLLAALQSQNMQGAGQQGHHHHHGGGVAGASGIQSGLQDLIQQLSSSNASSSSADTALQQSFQNLLSANGASGNQATLGSFLQTLSQNLQMANPSGNIVNTVG